MSEPDGGLRERLRLARFPRSSSYEPQWMIDNAMGPNPLWLTEWLWPAIDAPRGARVLDLGCGAAITSIFMAREYGVSVTAADLWITPTQNWARVRSASCAASVTPVHAEAHELPFAEEYFDAIVSIDAYHYFGTGELYLPYVSRFLRPGGVIGIAVPGLTAEFDEVPAHLAPFWEPAFWTFHSPAWWRRHWMRSAVVDVEVADVLDEGWRDWALWNDVCVAHGGMDAVVASGEREAEMLRLDAGASLGLVRVVGRKPPVHHGTTIEVDAASS